MEGSPHYKPAITARILNIRTHGRPEGAIYIGRGSKWGNKFRIGVDGGRNEVIAKYDTWIRQQPHLMASLHELRGKDLLCWCSPFRCHGDVLRELANG